MATAAQPTVADRLEAMLTEHLCLGGKDPSVPFDWDANLVNDLGADSLDQVELAVAFEEAFNVSIDDDTVDSWNTPADMRRTIEALV